MKRKAKAVVNPKVFTAPTAPMGAMPQMPIPAPKTKKKPTKGKKK